MEAGKMRLFTTEEMRAADRHAIEEVGIPGLVLMENAGIKSLITLEKILGGLKGKRFTIVCGKGNNGGDGLVIARHLFNNNVPVQVFIVAPPAEMSEEARHNCEILEKIGLEPVLLKSRRDIDRLRIAMEFSECVIDCVFGIGVKGDITGVAAEIVRAMNDTRACRVAIDVPSGLCATTGSLSDPCFNAQYTITMGAPKIGLFVFPGKRAAGEVWVADISLPEVSANSSDCQHFLLTAEMISSILPLRDDAMHKGNGGKVVLMAGSNEYPGAGIIASYGALRSGAGLVQLLLPDCLRGNLSCQVLPEVIVNYLPSHDGGFAIDAGQASEIAGHTGCLLVGPGWGRSNTRAESLKQLLKHWKNLAVVDADALNLISDHKLLKNAAGPLIITPHIGEMARLTGKAVDEIKDDQIGIARDFATKHKLTVVLKSAVTVIAEPGGKVYICSRPNSGMARGGSGDLLAGLICGLAASGIPSLHAALAGVFLFAEAGEIARNELGADAMTVSETASYLPAAFKKLRGNEPVNNS
ncbi:MAG: bifunctional ADP-dependent NAD(P)H-hydrate dehydratase/NAD(P)H-hydrate epimerase [Candidatus Riflebacteria bacterium HGW-Riflebacteria-2]|jgi:NAD(P)H-hydrate epimerase|nr:MAG: bifunctional ADP-dependent NAD(P)H-hydrate dehydratase/NAD(P)H-hydrate epimerase [Candidatus Riflebacteria bacterium HGW-Riflebacteria-2]